MKTQRELQAEARELIRLIEAESKPLTSEEKDSIKTVKVWLSSRYTITENQVRKLRLIHSSA